MDFIGQPAEVSRATGIPAYNLRSMLRKGQIKHGQKIGGRWYINATREWPKLKLERKVESGEK